MAEILIKAGATVDVPTSDEVTQAISQAWKDQANAAELVAARGIKWMRLPLMTGTASGSALLIDEKVNGLVGPEQGYAWSLRRVVVDGMTSGAAPDVVNMYRNATVAQPPLWQFNGNNFGYTFGRLEVVLFGGDSLRFASVGTFNATGQIRVSGELVELPAEMIAKMI